MYLIDIPPQLNRVFYERAPIFFLMERIAPNLTAIWFNVSRQYIAHNFILHCIRPLKGVGASWNQICKLYYVRL